MSAMEIDQPAQPYTFDLGNMLCLDSNPLLLSSTADQSSKETLLSTRAQSCAQALIHQLLTTCPITRSDDDGNLQVTLPPPSTPLPREKSVPKEKEKTKWQRFAEKKGIQAKKRDGKLEFDEAKGEWKPKYGYKGKRDAGGVPDDWMVEVDEKQERAAAEGDGRGRNTNGSDRRDKKMKVRRGK